MESKKTETMNAAQRANLPVLQSILQGVQDQIRFCDSKAQVVLGLSGILAGFLATQTPGVASAIAREWPGALAIGLLSFASLYLMSVIASFGFALRVILPRLDVSQPDSHIFFSHLAAKYKNNYEQIAKELPVLSDEEISKDVAKQVLANSHVCMRKHRALRRAWLLVTASIATWMATWLVFFFANFRAAFKSH